jgi:hypothetical protein
MPTITFELPDGVLSALRVSPAGFVREICTAAAIF